MITLLYHHVSAADVDMFNRLDGLAPYKVWTTEVRRRWLEKNPKPTPGQRRNFFERRLWLKDSVHILKMRVRIKNCD